MKKGITFLLFFLVVFSHIHAQDFEKGNGYRTVMTNSFWSDGYVQAGLDMSLQNPYGYDFFHVFPNGSHLEWI